MPKQFEGKTCVLCQLRASSPTGEHVWFLWLLKAFPPGKGYTWWIDGEQLLNRGGQPREQEAVDKVKLPVCIEPESTDVVVEAARLPWWGFHFCR